MRLARSILGMASIVTVVEAGSNSVSLPKEREGVRLDSPALVHALLYVTCGDRAVRADVIGLVAGHLPEQDRKSTRLNSSHVEISYAVFCLKKKKLLHQ